MNAEERMDRLLVNLNERYHCALREKEWNRTNLEKHIINLPKLGFTQTIKNIQYGRFAKRNYSTDGNRGGKQAQQKKIEPDKKIAVYSCIVGRYDSIIEPIIKQTSVDYLMFTDLDIPVDSAWTKVDITTLGEYNKLSSQMLNRKIKMLAHHFLKDYDYSIYVDGNIEIVGAITPILEQMGDAGLGLHYHNNRDCIYVEAVAADHYKRMAKESSKRQLETYKSEGMPEHFGLYENSIIIRDHSNQKVCDLMQQWWDEYQKYPTRDQLSLPYIVWRNNYKNEIFNLGNDLSNNPRFNRVQLHLNEKY